MVVPLTRRTAKDVSDGVQAGGSFGGLLDGRRDLALGGTLVDMNPRLARLRLGLVLGAVGNEGASDLVGVEKSGFLAVGLVQFILVGIGLNLEEICPLNGSAARPYTCRATPREGR